MDDSKEDSRLREVLTRAHANLIVALERAIADPATPADKRAEYREELGGVANGYVNLDCIDDDSWAQFMRERPNLDPLDNDEWREFITRHEPKAEGHEH